MNATETAAVTQLCTSYTHLLRQGGLAEIADEVASAACAEFLVDIDKAARAFALDVAPRTYRATFSANYRALFPDNGRLYRVDVLETSLDRHSAIWVNGEKFELSPEALAHAEALQHAWFGLGALLERWHAAQHDDGSVAAPGAARADLVVALKALDVAWARFECSYISELIAIEGQARQLVVRAVGLESSLRAMHRTAPAGETRLVERQLVELIGHMNSVANFKCKGRDDLGYDILESARRVLRRCDAKSRAAEPFTGAARDAARALAADVVLSYDAMRSYLRHVGVCIERVDPHLCNNAGLVARLVDWETSWEVGARYVRDAPLLMALCDLVSEVKAAQAAAPKLGDMFEDCDVELFLVLPRMIMLFFAADPKRELSELVHSLLPHRFRPCTPSSGVPGATTLNPELKALSEHFRRAMVVLQEALRSTEDDAWHLLVQRAVLGSLPQLEAMAGGGLPASALQVVEDLMRELESWSLELQRHCPQDWNQCSAVLVQCVTGRSKQQASSKFQV